MRKEIQKGMIYRMFGVDKFPDKFMHAVAQQTD